MSLVVIRQIVWLNVAHVAVYVVHHVVIIVLGCVKYLVALNVTMGVAMAAHHVVLNVIFHAVLQTQLVQM